MTIVSFFFCQGPSVGGSPRRRKEENWSLWLAVRARVNCLCCGSVESESLEMEQSNGLGWAMGS